jgi:hypothetical protein
VNLSDIRNEAWSIARERGTSDPDRLWTTTEMNRYINRTYRYIARECKCIQDSRTETVCRITVAPPANLAALQAAALLDTFSAEDLLLYNTAGSWLEGTLVAPRAFKLHDSIIDIDEVKWFNAPWRLTGVSVTKWQKNPRWEQVMGYPTEYALDYQTGYLTLNFRTATADTLMLKVVRLPVADLVAATDIPEFRTSYHDFIINGVLAQMYSKQDAETIDLKKAADYKAAFDRDVDEVKQQERILKQKLNVNSPMPAFL